MSEDFPEFSWGDHVDRNNRDERDELIVCPFTVTIDTREQAPFSFCGIRGDSKQKYRPLLVPTLKFGLETGDYSIMGMESLVTIERKSPGDAFSTFTHERDRFERELERMQSMRWAAVVIECGWEAITAGPQKLDRSEQQSKVIGKTVYRSILAWMQRYPKVHWLPMPSRVAAERVTFRLLERFWLDRQEERKAK